MSVAAERPVGVERQVPAEAESRVGRRDHAVVHDEPVADARPDGHDGEGGPSAHRAEPLLGRREGGDVVLDGDRHAELALEPLGERHVAPAEERRTRDDALVGDVAADADAQPGDLRPVAVAVAEPRHEVGHRSDDGVDVVRDEPSLTLVERARTQVGDDAECRLARELHADEPA